MAGSNPVKTSLGVLGKNAHQFRRFDVNKRGEIVKDKDGKVIELNGYDGGERNSFEFVELSEYYNTINKAFDELGEIILKCDKLKKEIMKLI